MSDRSQEIAEARRRLLQKRLAAKASQNQPKGATIPKISSDVPALASLGQQRLWYVQQLHPENTAYHMTNLTHITGALDVVALQKSLQLITEKQAILRTGFDFQNTVLVQQVQESIEIKFEHRQISADDLDTEIQAVVDKPFDLKQAPVWRAMLFEVAPQDYYFVIVLHHIICDEWSIDILWQSLGSCYEAYIQNNTPNLDSPDIQYTDYATWQHQQIQENQYDGQLDYWREQLSGDLPLLELPSDHVRPAVQQMQGQLIEQQLDKQLSAQLSQLSKDANTTLFTTLIAAYQVLLYRYTSQNDVLVGIPVANRSNAQIQKLMGFFLNTLVLHADFTETMSFRDLLNVTSQRNIEALKHQGIPFDLIVDELKPKRDPSYNPIFQTMFVYQDASAHHPQLPNLSVEPMQIDAGVSKFDTTLFARLDDENIQLGLEFDTALFDLTTAESLLHHYQLLLQQIVAHPDTDIADLDIVSQVEYDLFTVWNDTAFAIPENTLIQDLITRHPSDTIAVQTTDGDVTYDQLIERANYVAQQLIDHGVQPNTFVGLYTERSLDMLVSILGVLLAGGAYVPIDPSYPEERIKYILEDADIDIVVGQPHLKRNIKSDVSYLDLTEERSVTTPTIDTAPDNLAYMIYTSGSTGNPKGVRVTHHNLISSTLARFEVYQKNSIEKFLLLSSFAFDSSIVGIFWSLCDGATLCLPPHESEKSVNTIVNLIKQWQITHTLALPSLYQIMIEYAQPFALDSLKTVIVAGEACSLGLVKDHYHVLPETSLFNEYGPTEGTVWATAYEIPADAKSILIGKPIPNMQVQIVDKRLKPVPIGVAGEIMIYGEGITQGYHNRPDITAEKFQQNGYLTGDLGRYLPDGNIDFLGRIDFQVKISGYRIEPGEIEATLMENPAIQEAIVVLIDKQEYQASSVEDITAKIVSEDAESMLAEIENLDPDTVKDILFALLGE